MIILDTNVISALMRHDPDGVVVGWLDDQPAQSIWITTVSVFEVHFGLELLPRGHRRRRQLEDAFARALDDEFEGRILPFEPSAARAAAARAAQRRQQGRPIEIRDALIAGIVSARRAALAARNTGHFADLGIRLIDPWSQSRRPPKAR